MGKVLNAFTHGYPGAISRAVDDIVISLPNGDSDEIPFGTPVFLNTAGSKGLKPTETSTADRFAGIAVRSRRLQGDGRIREIAEDFGISESNAKMTLSRTREKLKKHLLKEGYDLLYIGFSSGLLGVVVTYLLCIPINIIVYKLTELGGLKAYLPIYDTPSERITFSRFWQSRKALLPMCVLLPGMVMLLMPLHLQKAYSSMLSTVFGIVTLSTSLS